MTKQIYFHVDAGSMPISFYGESTSMSYYETCELLSEKADTIHTTDMAHFSFDLIDMGYEIYLCYKGKKVKIEPDMTIEPIGKHLKRGHNIRKLFIGHAFDDMLGIEDKKSVMQPKFLVSDEVVCEMTVRKVEEVRYSTEFNSYMYKLDKGGWFLESALKPNVQDNKKAYFKVGDFICHKYNSIYGDCRQICDISGDSYLCTVPGSVAATCSISFSEQGNWRLWYAAKDAKDGDVLALDGSVFIYAHRKQLYDIAVSHCFVNQYGEFFLDGEFGYTECGVQVLPATKEQRDMLFSKIKEEGYEWDEKKKEIRKIIEPKFKVGDRISWIGHDWDTQTIVEIKDGSYITVDKHGVRCALKFAKQDEWELAPKPHYDIANFHAGMPVLVRDKDNRKWCYLLYSHYDNTYEDGLCFNAGSVDWRQCIPFEGNEHLLGTTDMPDEMYINWR